MGINWQCAGKCRDSGWYSSGTYMYHYVLMCILGLYFVTWTAVKKNVERTVDKCCNKTGIEVRVSIDFSEFDCISELL